MATARPTFASLSVIANLERHKLLREPWILLLDLTYPGIADPLATQQHVRLARNTEDVTFDAGDGLGPQIYQAFNFDVGDVTTATDGSVPDTVIKVSNVMRLLQSTVEQYGGCVGSLVNLYVLNAASPAGEPELALSFTVKDTTCDARLVTFKLGVSSPLRRNFPLHLYRPNYCIWVYNSPALQAQAAADPSFRNPGKQCGYIGTMPTCSHTIDGTTGCQAHGNLIRIGTFPGIDSNGGASASVA